MNILLTGGSGLLGKALVSLLRGQHDLRHFDVTDPCDGLPYTQGDLRDYSAVEDACQGPDAVVHMAALHGAAWSKAGDDVGFDVNVTGTKNILEAARKCNVKRVVLTSSIWATGHSPDPAPYLPLDEEAPRQPRELYGLTKLLGEQMCRYASSQYGFSTICLRPGGIVPADAPIARRMGLLFGAVDVRDVATAHKLALEAPGDMVHEAYVITANSPLRGIKPARFFANPVGTLEELVPGIGGLLTERKVAVPEHAEWYTIAKAQRTLGYHPRHNFEVAKL